jgi:gluconate 5-dehydrogenase
VVNFTRSLAAEWAPHNINVNAIAPGFFPTKMTQGLRRCSATRRSRRARR